MARTPEYIDVDMVVTVRVPVTLGKRGCPDSSLLNWGSHLLESPYGRGWSGRESGAAIPPEALNAAVALTDRYDGDD